MSSISFPCFIKNVRMGSHVGSQRAGLLPQGMTSASSLKTFANSTFRTSTSYGVSTVSHNTIKLRPPPSCPMSFAGPSPPRAPPGSGLRCPI